MTLQARDSEQQGVRAIRCDVAYNTPGISSGLLFGKLPKDSFIIAVAIDVTTAFNAASTNVLTIGTSTTANELWDASALAETAGSQLVVPIAAATASQSATTPLYVKYAQTGTAASAGAATIVVLYATSLPAYTPSALST